MKKWEAMREIAMILLESVAEKAKVEKITEILQRFLGVSRCVILTIRGDGEEYEITTAKPSSIMEHGIGESGVVAGKTAIEKVLKTKKVLLVSDAKNNPLTQYMSHWAAIKNINAVLFVPIVIDEEVEAIMVFDATGERFSFSEEEIDFIVGCAGFIKELFAKEKESHRWLIQAQHQEQISFSQRFCSDVGHLVRNPLQSIGGFARRITKLVEGAQEEERFPAETQTKMADKILEYSAIIKNEAGKIEKTLGDLIGLAQIGQELKWTETDINVLILKTIEELKSEKLPIHCQLDPETISTFKLDVDKMSMALKYLLANLFEEAIQQPEDLQEITIHTRCAKFRKEIFIVSYGKIKTEALEYFFKPFNGAKISAGTGLGLPLAKKLIALNGGDLTIKEEYGKTICRITFPILKNKQEQPA